MMLNPSLALFSRAVFRGGATPASDLLAGATGLAIVAATSGVYAAVNGHTTDFDGNANHFLSYTSPSTKYVRNAAGILVPGTTLRTDHAVGGTPLGVLVEGAQENIQIHSEQIEEWFLVNSTVDENVYIAPDGTQTGDRWVEAESAAVHNIRSMASATITEDETVSIVARLRPNGRRFATISGTPGVSGGTGDNNWFVGTFDLQEGELTDLDAAGNGVAISGLIEPDYDGWFRCRVSGTLTATSIWTFIGGATTGEPSYSTRGRQSYAGTGETLGIWGVEIKHGVADGSYIKTVAAAATRNADDITIPLASFPWNSGSGTLTLNGETATPVTDGGDLDIAATVIGAGETHLESLTWLPD